MVVVECIFEQGLYVMCDVQVVCLVLFYGDLEKVKELINEVFVLLLDDSIEWVKFVKLGKKINFNDD